MSLAKLRFAEMVVFAFISFVLLSTSPDSYWADQHHMHWLYIVVGILAGLFAIFKLIQIMRNDSTPPAR